MFDKLKRNILIAVSLSMLVLTGCNEQQKIDALTKENAALLLTADSLSKALEKLNSSPSSWQLLSDTVHAGEGMFQILSRMKIGEAERRKVVLALQDSVELSSMKVGQVFMAVKDSQGVVQRFRYASNPANIHILNRKGDDFVYKFIKKKTSMRQSAYEGVLEPGGTLNGLLYKVGIPGRMIGVVSSVLQCKVSFPMAQPGDKFRILLEEEFYQDSIWISGKVLYAEFNGRTVGHHEAFRYEDADPKSSYNAHYTESGEALVYVSMRYPLDRMHVGSPFGYRIHPILGTRKLHAGVDLSAGMGTPIYAVADGVVAKSTYDGASGNYVAIRHSDNTQSYYMHMSARLVTAGQQVKARQIIGKVGSTGRSTGPHLHFGFKNEKGDWINPLSKTMIATPKLEGDRFKRLKKQISGIKSDLEKTLAAPAVKANDTTDVMVRMRNLK